MNYAQARTALQIVLAAGCISWIGIPALAEDNYEGNNSLAAAFDIRNYEQTWLSTINGQGEQYDDDWYRIYFTGSSSRILIQCTFFDPDGNINLELYDSDGVLLRSSRSSTNNEWIDYDVAGATSHVHYIRVYGDNAGNQYDLWWDDVAPISQDPYEYVYNGIGYVPNNDRSNAWYAGRDWERQWLTEMLGFAQIGDDDWYEIDVSSVLFNRVLVLCTFSHAAGNISLELYDDTGTRVARSVSNDDNEHIDYQAPAGGKYYIHVYGGNAGQGYNLWWDDTATITGDDPYELHWASPTQGAIPTDTLDNAWHPANTGAWMYWSGIPLSDLLGLAQQGDNDCYEIRVNSPSRLRLITACTFSDMLGSMGIGVYDMGGTLLRGTLFSNGSDNRYLDFELPGGGTYYIRVYGDDAGNNYDLCWDYFLPTDDDVYEENDTSSTAFLHATAWENQWLSMKSGIGIQNDDDWYAVEVAPAGFQRVLVECKFYSSRGDINLELYDDLGNLLQRSDTLTNDEYIDYRVLGTGTYLIRVYGDNAGNSYDLFYDDLRDDSYEENDVRAEAYDLSGKEQTWLKDYKGMGVMRDDDWYQIEVSPNYLRVDVDCRFKHTQGNIDISLHDDSGTTLATSTSTDDNEYLVHLVGGPGTYYIRVYSPDGITDSAYNLWWDDRYDTRTFQFSTNAQGWTWFDYSPALVAPLHGHNDVDDCLDMVETAGDQVVFGSWETPKNPLLAIQPISGLVYRARYSLRSSVDGAACPGFRMRAATAHVIDTGGGVYQPDFSNQDFFPDHELFYSTLNAFHLAGREPGTAGKTYTLLAYPGPSPSLQDPDVIMYFTCDLLDLDTFDSDAGMISIDSVTIDSFPGIAALFTGARVPELSFNDTTGANTFSDWAPLLMPLDPANINITGIGVDKTDDELRITVQPGNRWFVATISSEGTPLESGHYYAAGFRIAATTPDPANFAPTVRAGFYSKSLVFSCDKQLAGGATNARFTDTPQWFWVFMEAPSEQAAGHTEDIGLRFMSWLRDSNTGWPFFSTVAGTVVCDQILTTTFPIP